MAMVCLFFVSLLNGNALLVYLKIQKQSHKVTCLGGLKRLKHLISGCFKCSKWAKIKSPLFKLLKITFLYLFLGSFFYKVSSLALNRKLLLIPQLIFHTDLIYSYFNLLPLKVHWCRVSEGFGKRLTKNVIFRL